MDEKNKKLIKDTIEEMFAKMGFECNVEIKEDKNDEGSQENYICDVQTKDDSSFLIGQYGINLQAIQHLARLLIRKKTSEKTKFIIDVNSYRQQKNDSIMEVARETANQALREKRAVIMRPMSNYERRLVHLELSKNDKVSTESIGDGEGRKVVVKPAEEL